MKDKITDRLSRRSLDPGFCLSPGISPGLPLPACSRHRFCPRCCPFPGMVIAIGAGSLLLFLLFLALLPLLRKLSARQERLLLLGVLAVIFLGQPALIFGIHQSTFMYDPYRVFDEALHMQTTHTVSGTAMEGYYAIYPNNIPFTLLIYWIVRLGAGLGLTDTGLMVLLQMLNALCMDAAVFFTAILLKKYVSILSMRLFLVICLLNPLVYLWPGFVYTSTVSMPFIMGGLLLFLELFQEERPYRKNFLAVGLGIVVLVLGFQIRATVLITLIAGIIYFVLGVLPQTAGRDSIGTAPDQKHTPTRKSTISSAIILLLSMAVTFSAWESIQRQYMNFGTTDTAFPVVSWLAMGLEGDGMFNTQDYYDTEKCRHCGREKSRQRRRDPVPGWKKLGIRGWLDLAGDASSSVPGQTAPMTIRPT